MTDILAELLEQVDSMNRTMGRFVLNNQYNNKNLNDDMLLRVEDHTFACFKMMILFSEEMRAYCIVAENYYKETRDLTQLLITLTRIVLRATSHMRSTCVRAIPLLGRLELINDIITLSLPSDRLI